MLEAACQQFLGKREEDIRRIAQETLEGHQRAIMGNMTVEVLQLTCPSFFSASRFLLKIYILPSYFGYFKTSK